jgi:hypothetical protein
MALNRMTLNRMALNRMTLNRVTLNRVTLNRMKLNRMKLNRMTMNIMADRPKIFNKMTQVNYDCIIVIIRFLNYVERLYLDSILRLGNF